MQKPASPHTHCQHRSSASGSVAHASSCSDNENQAKVSVRTCRQHNERHDDVCHEQRTVLRGRQHLHLRRGVPERRLPGLRLAASLLHCPHCQETCAASRGRHAPARSDLVAHLALGVCVEGAAKTPRTHTGAHQDALFREQADRRGPVGATCEGCTLSAHSRTLRHSDGVVHVRRYSSLLYTLVQPVAV